jgi:hypothetical protein
MGMTVDGGGGARDISDGGWAARAATAPNQVERTDGDRERLSGLDGSGGLVTVTSTASTITGNHQPDFTFQGKKS